MLDINKIKNTILQGDTLKTLKQIPDKSVNMVITSPPYWGLKNYGIDGQLGVERTFNEYIVNLILIFNETKRVLREDGVCFVNIGDTYSANRPYQITGTKQVEGSQPDIGKQPQAKDNNYQVKCLYCIPDRFKIAMIDNGWICRNEIIWHKPNAMPQSVKDRFTDDYEKIFLFSKNKKYYFEQQKEIALNGKTRNVRSVWSINTKPLKEAHFATYPEKLIETPIKSGCPEDGIVLDIFMGSGTTGVVAKKLHRNYIGIELNPEYIEIANSRIKGII